MFKKYAITENDKCMNDLADMLEDFHDQFPCNPHIFIGIGDCYRFRKFIPSAIREVDNAENILLGKIGYYRDIPVVVTNYVPRGFVYMTTAEETKDLYAALREHQNAREKFESLCTTWSSTDEY